MRPDSRIVNSLTTEELEIQLQELWDRVRVAHFVCEQDYDWFGKREIALALDILSDSHDDAVFWGQRVHEIYRELLVRGASPRWDELTPR